MNAKPEPKTACLHAVAVCVNFQIANREVVNTGRKDREVPTHQDGESRIITFRQSFSAMALLPTRWLAVRVRPFP